MHKEWKMLSLSLSLDKRFHQKRIELSTSVSLLNVLMKGRRREKEREERDKCTKRPPPIWASGEHPNDHNLCLITVVIVTVSTLKYKGHFLPEKREEEACTQQKKKEWKWIELTRNCQCVLTCCWASTKYFSSILSLTHTLHSLSWVSPGGTIKRKTKGNTDPRSRCGMKVSSNIDQYYDRGWNETKYHSLLTLSLSPNIRTHRGQLNLQKYLSLTC